VPGGGIGRPVGRPARFTARARPARTACRLRGGLPETAQTQPVQEGTVRQSQGSAQGRQKKTDLTEELQERILLKEGGKPKQVSKQRAMLKSLMAKALHGDARAATLLVNLVARLVDQSEQDDPSTPLAADDAAILAAFEARIRNTTPHKG
jgi:Family of unknown function (DUF5681)